MFLVDDGPWLYTALKRYGVPILTQEKTNTVQV